MKEILYRGKSIESNQWVEGYYLIVEDFETGIEQPVIVPFGAEIYAHGEISEFEFVDPFTVGQWTGLVDRNSKKIFEGDILINANIAYQRGSAKSCFIFVNDIRDVAIMRLRSSNYEVVGNVYDNRELIDDEERKIDIYEYIKKN